MHLGIGSLTSIFHHGATPKLACHLNQNTFNGKLLYLAKAGFQQSGFRSIIA